MTESDSVLRVCWQQGGDSDMSVSTPKETNMERSKTEISHNWLPLERAIRSSFWDDFMHMGADGTIQKYKHRDTRRYLYIDSDCERFYRWVGGDGETKYEETSKAGALSRVLPCAGTANSLGLAPTSFRAANLLAAFLTFQGYATKLPGRRHSHCSLRLHNQKTRPSAGSLLLERTCTRSCLGEWVSNRRLFWSAGFWNRRCGRAI